MPSAITLKTIFKAVDKMTAPIKAMTKASKGFGRKTQIAMAKAERSVRKLMSPVTRLTKKFGGIAAIAGGLTLGAAVSAGATAFVDLDKNISAASAKFGVFDRDSDVFKSIRKKALEMGATTEFTSGQAAEGMKNLATAGFTAKQSIAGLEKVLNLATATQSELGTASNVAAKSLAAFGLKSDDPKVLNQNLGMVSDTLNKLITSSGFGNLDEVLTTIGASGASAKAAGLSIQTWASAVGTAVTAGVDASSAGTQLNMALTKLAKPSAEGQKMLSKLGVKVQDSAGNYRDFLDILTDVEKGTKGMGSRTKAAALSTIFGARSQKMINVLLEKGAAGMKKYRKEIEGAQGITGKMAGFMRQGMAGAIAAMKSAFEAVAITIGDTFQPEIDKVIEGLTKVARNSGDWLAKNKPLIKMIFKIAKAIALYFVGLKAILILIKTWNAVTKVAAAVQAAFNAIMALNPIFLIIMGIALLIAGLILMIKHWDKVSAKMKEWRESSVFQIISLLFPILKIIDLIAFFGERWKAIKAIFKSQGIVEGIKAIGKTLLSFVLKPVEVLLKTLAKIPKVGDKVAPAIAKLESFRAGLDAGLVEGETPGEESKAVNLAATKNSVEEKRFEEIKNQNIAIELKNKTDKDAKVASNPGMIPVTTETW